MGAPAALCTRPVEIHHTVPRCLLTLRDRADACGLDGEGIEAWLEYEHEAMRWSVDPDVSRNELVALVDASTVALERGEHRSEHASDFVRWGRRGGLQTLRRYGHAWFGLLGRRRHGRITSTELAAAATELSLSVRT